MYKILQSTAVHRGVPGLVYAKRHGTRTLVRPRLGILEEMETISFESLKQNKIQNVNISFEEFYRVMLHYSAWSDDKETARKVIQAVSILRMNEAIRIVDSARRYGRSIVTTVPKEEAELYTDNLVRIGLKATLELA